MHRLRLINFLNKFGVQCSKTVGSCANVGLRPSMTVTTKEFLAPVSDITSNTIRNYNANQSNKRLSEEEFLIKVKDDPDVFGSSIHEEDFEDEGDIREEKFISNKPLRSQQLSTKQYADIIKNYISKRKIKEAIDVLEVKMLKEDRVQPENYIYNLILGACGRVGYTKKAFMLYNDMKKRGLKIHAGTYTALFNACANSPWPEDGLSRAKHLREIMIECHYLPNEPNYHSMIKAFGRCGDLPMAFSLVDEMTKRFPLKADTLNFLLQACIGDKEAGFRHSLLVWRKFIERGVKPNIYTFNLFLRSIRDCSLGNVAVTRDVINKITGSTSLLNSTSQDYKLIEGNDEKLLQKTSIEETQINEMKENEVISTKEESTTLVQENNFQENRPNLMGKIAHLGNILQLSEVTKPQDRLLLVGGMTGYLDTMKEHSVEPDIKTFTMLLDNIPPAKASEDQLLNLLKMHKLKPDVDFYNMLIKRRALRQDYAGAQEILSILKDRGYQPDLITYGVLAICCKTKAEAQDLLTEMEEHRYRINIEILGAMLHRACYNLNFPYVIEVMDWCRKEHLTPNKIFMDRIEEFYRFTKKISNDKADERSKNIGFQKGYNRFRIQYKVFKEEIGKVDEEEPHPWQQYRENTETDVRHYKDKEVHFKKQYKTKFRQKQAPVEIVEKPKFIKRVSKDKKWFPKDNVKRIPKNSRAEKLEESTLKHIEET